MKKIYEPEDIGELDEVADCVPNIELIPDQLRIHFHGDGVSFGLVDPRNPEFSVCLSYVKARSLMLRAAEQNAARKARKKRVNAN